MSNFADQEAGARRVDVAIVGADPAGLIAAFQLTRAGRSVALIEADALRVGGVARTFEHDGCRFEAGAHRFTTGSLRVARLWRDMLPRGFDRRRSETRYHTVAARDAAQVVEAGFVQRLSDAFGDLVRPFLPDADAADTAPGEVCSESFFHPRNGAGAVWAGARDAILASGRGEVLMGHTLGRLARDGRGGWRLTAAGAEGESTILADAVLSALPPRDLLARLHPLPAAALASDALRHRDMLTVALIMRGPQPFKPACVEIDDPSVNVRRVRNVRAWSPAMLSQTHVQCVCLDYECDDDDGLMALNEEKITFLAMAELQALGLGDLRNVDGSIVVRLPKAMPICDAPSAEIVAGIVEQLASTHPGLQLIGRCGLHREGGVHADAVTALAAVDRILAGSAPAQMPADLPADQLADRSAADAAPAATSGSRLPAIRRAA